ncbi:hypothetical protein CONCODRAFT_49004 [Conidiobolus coronatus NRRL 28638]|uniref:Ribosomal protein S6 n=1 Tax=Conidiobolus coronatus (strain ATCC 28846 / CBS 209.66 / NRRL 28638) TaxID=796925 RepID=A0A137P894_CONC2|nr:hypothetical protein CONCODRAFT_49004 [Conidiobolus coronatus NRRL 28638]|eukprot:KXN71228.1 hypothetical protein CONCODRAFT_49004 [Conidiobolus coronatus NRRL 28638]
MPLYEALLITRNNLEIAALSSILKQTCTQIWKQQGVVRKVANYGPFTLPHKIKKNQMIFTHGQKLTLHFDSNPFTLADIRNQLKADPRIIRFGIVKLGDNLPSLVQDIK